MVELNVVEKLALDILVMSFCTISRVHEVTALTIDCVAEDGSYMLVRPKTEARG